MYTYIHTCLSLQYIPPSLPPSPLLHIFYYDIHIQPGILIGQSLQNSSKRYIRLALVSQAARQNYNSIDRQLLLVVPKTY